MILALSLLCVAVAGPRWGVELGPQFEIVAPVQPVFEQPALQRRTASLAARGSAAWPLGAGRAEAVVALDGGLWNRNWVWHDDVTSATEVRGELTGGLRVAVGPGRLEGGGFVPFVEAGAGVGASGTAGSYDPPPALRPLPVYPAGSLGLGVALPGEAMRPLVVARGRGGLLWKEGLSGGCAAPCESIQIHPGGAAVELLIGAMWP